jgi:hypothetical protein
MKHGRLEFSDLEIEKEAEGVWHVLNKINGHEHTVIRREDGGWWCTDCKAFDNQLPCAHIRGVKEKEGLFQEELR